MTFRAIYRFFFLRRSKSCASFPDPRTNDLFNGVSELQKTPLSNPSKKKASGPILLLKPLETADKSRCQPFLTVANRED